APSWVRNCSIASFIDGGSSPHQSISLTHRFFDGSQHFLYRNFPVGSHHSAVASSSGRYAAITLGSRTVIRAREILVRFPPWCRRRRLFLQRWPARPLESGMAFPWRAADGTRCHRNNDRALEALPLVSWLKAPAQLMSNALLDQTRPES